MVLTITPTTLFAQTIHQSPHHLLPSIHTSGFITLSTFVTSASLFLALMRDHEYKASNELKGAHSHH
jgi:hypothetical protein